MCVKLHDRRTGSRRLRAGLLPEVDHAWSRLEARTLHAIEELIELIDRLAGKIVRLSKLWIRTPNRVDLLRGDTPVGAHRSRGVDLRRVVELFEERRFVVVVEFRLHTLRGALEFRRDARFLIQRGDQRLHHPHGGAS